MFCPECGNQLAEGQKYCDECGTKIPVRKVASVQQQQHYKEHHEQASQPPPAQDMYYLHTVNANTQDDAFYGYLNKYIQQTTTFTSVVSLLNGARPLRLMWIIFGAMCLILALFSSIGVVLVACLAFIPISQIVLSLLVAARGRKSYTTWGRYADIDDLACFLEEQLYSLNFTAWERGNPTVLGMTCHGLLVIKCIFNGKTYHQIVFDEAKPGSYRIESSKTTAKERLKHAGDINYSLLFKADYVTRPILEAATKYYFRYLAQ